MSKPCADSSTGCTGMAVKGNILCETCLETKKALAKNRRDVEMDLLQKRIKELEYTLNSQKQLYEKKIEDATCSIHLEKDSVKQGEMIRKLREENQHLVDEKSKYEMTYKQTQLDNEKLNLDIKRLVANITALTEQNKALVEENKTFSQLLTKK